MILVSVAEPEPLELHMEQYLQLKKGKHCSVNHIEDHTRDIHDIWVFGDRGAFLWMEREDTAPYISYPHQWRDVVITPKVKEFCVYESSADSYNPNNPQHLSRLKLGYTRAQQLLEAIGKYFPQAPEYDRKSLVNIVNDGKRRRMIE